MTGAGTRAVRGTTAGLAAVLVATLSGCGSYAQREGALVNDVFVDAGMVRLCEGSSGTLLDGTASVEVWAGSAPVHPDAVIDEITDQGYGAQEVHPTPDPYDYINDPSSTTWRGYQDGISVEVVARPYDSTIAAVDAAGTDCSDVSATALDQAPESGFAYTLRVTQTPADADAAPGSVTPSLEEVLSGEHYASRAGDYVFFHDRRDETGAGEVDALFVVVQAQHTLYFHADRDGLDRLGVEEFSRFNVPAHTPGFPDGPTDFTGDELVEARLDTETPG